MGHSKNSNQVYDDEMSQERCHGAKPDCVSLCDGKKFSAVIVLTASGILCEDDPSPQMFCLGVLLIEWP